MNVLTTVPERQGIQVDPALHTPTPPSSPISPKYSIPPLIFFLGGAGATIAAALDEWEWSLGFFGLGLICEIAYSVIFVRAAEARIAAQAERLTRLIEENQRLGQEALGRMGQIVQGLSQADASADRALDFAEQGRMLSVRMGGKLKEGKEEEGHILATAVSTSDLNRRNVETTRELEDMVDEEIAVEDTMLRREQEKIKGNAAFLARFRGEEGK